MFTTESLNICLNIFQTLLSFRNRCSQQSRNKIEFIAPKGNAQHQNGPKTHQVKYYYRNCILMIWNIFSTKNLCARELKKCNDVLLLLLLQISNLNHWLLNSQSSLAARFTAKSGGCPDDGKIWENWISTVKMKIQKQNLFSFIFQVDSMLIDVYWFWSMLINADWFWLMLTDTYWCWKN